MKFLHSCSSKNADKRIVKRVRLLCMKQESRLQIAVSYWGKGALTTTRLRERIEQKNSKPIQVLCDLLSGACNPEPIEELTKKSKNKVQVKTLSGLHAKVWICESQVIVGSANVSANGLGFDDRVSQEGNMEAAIEVDQMKFAEEVKSWFNEQWERAEPVDASKIQTARERWKRRRNSDFMNEVKEFCNKQKSPNSVVPQVPGKEINNRFERYRIFYEGLLEALKGTDVPGEVNAPRKSGCFFRSGRSYLNFAAHFGEGNKVRVELRLNKPRDQNWNKQKFKKIALHKELIQKNLGPDIELKWEFKKDKQTSRIATYRCGDISNDESTLVEINEWFVKNLIAFKRAFEPYLDD